MSDYRLFVMTPPGHIQRSHEFHAADDEAARDLGRALADGQRSELWSRSRLVATFEPQLQFSNL